ncbi:hypothetical protein [Streptomyces sp. NPDC020298]|uniref:hypothetical protein n=1 Tax=unclassified Streptomyces TaxID=2593676 RepID=UPI0033EF71DA
MLRSSARQHRERGISDGLGYGGGDLSDEQWAVETLVHLERMEAVPFLLRGRWEEELETVFLDDLEFVWGPRIRLSR